MKVTCVQRALGTEFGGEVDTVDFHEGPPFLES
jgi:hypothetical protein